LGNWSILLLGSSRVDVVDGGVLTVTVVCVENWRGITLTDVLCNESSDCFVTVHIHNHTGC